MIRAIFASELVTPLISRYQVHHFHRRESAPTTTTHSALALSKWNPFAIVAGRNAAVAVRSPRVPLEISEEIIDCVAAQIDETVWLPELDPWRRTLLSCALVCRAWYHHSQFYLRQFVELRDRNQVLALSKLVRDNPRLGRAVRFVAVSGGSTKTIPHPIPHFGTFVPMLAGKLPNTHTLRLENAEWRIGSISPDTIRYLAMFPSVTTLELRGVTFATVSQLAQLVSALPALRSLKTDRTLCKQVHLNMPTRLPLNARELKDIDMWWNTAPAILEFCTCLSEAALLCTLAICVDEYDALQNRGGRQTLINTSARSLKKLRFGFHTYGLGPEDVDCVAQHVNLSRLVTLEHLILDSRSFLGADHSWIPKVLATVESEWIQRVDVCFIVGARLRLLNTMLISMERLGFLARMDEMLARRPFAKLRPFSVYLTIDMSICAPDDNKLHINLEGEKWPAWDELVRRNMVKSNKRGILCTRITRTAP
ncbi:hypothetical protein EVJ58_g3897 [Rhodofomes roseus]|uniref:F-box domain-containing protein n=1 Tax=Rhodofomes roseus TaxID=34475 RepID=A0A4Y9YN24_9APHY|nr:hypothetical protein EVJ58_g3897 [Rhodofomes roseus]